MKKSARKPKGFIAIVSLLIITTVAMFFAVQMLLDGVNNAALSLNGIYYERARFNIDTCLDDTLMRIQKESQFNRNLSYNISDLDSCSTTILWLPPSQIKPGVTERLVNLTVTGISKGFTRTFDYDLRIVTYDVNSLDSITRKMNRIDFISIDEANT